MNILWLFMQFLLLAFATATVPVIVKEAEGYYWRDYKGEIPSDAVPGGSDKYGRTTYIGQALHISPPNGKLIPGKVDAAAEKMYYAWDDTEYEVTKNIKILCSQHPEQFEWTETDIETAKSMSQKDLVFGGYDTDYSLFIGKIHADGEVVIGKVTLQTPYDGIGYTVNGKAYFVKTSFAILSYNSEKISSGSSCPTEKISSESSCAAKKIININMYW